MKHLEEFKLNENMFSSPDDFASAMHSEILKKKLQYLKRKMKKEMESRSFKIDDDDGDQVVLLSVAIKIAEKYIEKYIKQ
jgi:hypothetical protein